MQLQTTTRQDVLCCAVLQQPAISSCNKTTAASTTAAVSKLAGRNRCSKMRQHAHYYPCTSQRLHSNAQNANIALKSI